jgi:peptide/nickel transport system substrate-binding protein
MFHDGTVCDAAAVKWNFDRWGDPNNPYRNASDTFEYYEDVAGFTDAIGSVDVLDALTLQITLNAPQGPFLLNMALPAFGIASPTAMMADIQNAYKNPVGTGPFKFQEYVQGDHLSLVRNPNYWKTGLPYLDGIRFQIFKDPQSMLVAFEAGQLDAVNTPPIRDTARYQKDPNWRVVFNDIAGDSYVITFNTTRAPTNNKLLRQAINYAIDRDAMLKAVAKGRGTVTGQIFPTTSPAYDESLDSTYAFDPAKAKQLLADAGYADGFELDMPLIQGTTVVNDLIKQYLGDVGITVNYTQLSINDAISAILAPKYAASWFQLQMDPTAWQLANFQIATKATWNPFHVDDPQVDKFMNTIQNGNEAAADQAAASLNKYVVDQAWFAPFYRVEGNFVADGNTDVVQQSDNAYPYLWNIKPKA